MRRVLSLAVTIVATAYLPVFADDPADPSRYNVIWNAPGANSSDSMPLGNGDIGLNVWTEPGGDIVFYIAKTDAVDALGRLLKVGRVRLSVPDCPIAAQGADGSEIPFVQTLDLPNGRIVVKWGEDANRAEAVVWVDAHRPVIHVEVKTARPSKVQAAVELWRNERRRITDATELDSIAMTVSGREGEGAPDRFYPLFEDPDTVLDEPGDAVIWYHRNEASIWPKVLEVQELPEYAAACPERDPLLGRTFGGLLEGAGMKRPAQGVVALESAAPATEHHIRVHVLTDRTKTPEAWVSGIKALRKEAGGVDARTAYDAHVRWWNEFWNRAWIHISGPPDQEEAIRRLEHGYALQRFINACAGRGALPIKFNGSLFTVDGEDQGTRLNADYRRWGACYWFQNTRLPYWTMLASGDFEMMLPLFEMYKAALPFAEFRTKAYYGHEGAFFPETMYFWGCYRNCCYGWNREGLDKGFVLNPYIRYYWSSGLELTLMMLDYADYAGDEPFARQTLVPLADAVVTFYDEHYPRDAGGRIRFTPAQSLETWWDVENPLPIIAGLRAVLPRLLSLPEHASDEEQRKKWRRLLAELPPLPAVEEDGAARLLPAESGCKEISNSENPELYAVFPYRLYTVGKPDLDVGIRTFERRQVKGHEGWRQDEIQAAHLGLADVAADYLLKRAASKHAGSRFPAFWGPNFDWIPDQDHGGCLMKGLQSMLVQADAGKIYVLPAWPKEWDVSFKLHAPGRTTVEVVYQGGEIRGLEVKPQSQRRDVVFRPDGS